LKCVDKFHYASIRYLKQQHLPLFDNSSEALLQISQVLNDPLAFSFLIPRVAQSSNALLKVAREATVSGRQ
jgi:hypothetical protein